MWLTEVHNHFSFVVARRLEIVKATKALTTSERAAWDPFWGWRLGHVPLPEAPHSPSGAPDPIVPKLLSLSSLIDL